jgi:hypothetical protein
MMPGRPLFRAPPGLPAHAMKTYQIASPVQTHTRPAVCAEVECQAYRVGWSTAVDVATELGRKQAQYIRMHSGRAFEVVIVGTVVTFTFPAGQRCFTQHRVPLERPALYVIRDGDWRGNPRQTEPVRVGPDAWVDDFANHQDRLKTVFDQG